MIPTATIIRDKKMHTTPIGYRQNEKQNMYNNEEKIKKIVGVEKSNHRTTKEIAVRE
jgi:hypothetical protein